MKTLPFDDTETVHVAHNDKYIVVGSIVNIGMIPDFWIKKDNTFTIDEHLQFIMDIVYESDQRLQGHIEL